MFQLKLYNYIPEGSVLDAMICRRPGPGVLFQIPTSKPSLQDCGHYEKDERTIKRTKCMKVHVLRLGVRIRSNRWALAFSKAEGDLHVPAAAK